MILWVQFLRAVAVISVIIFHIDNNWLPSGFLGVDLFFVISGFVITRSICKSIERNEFNILKFYINRLWRILPALIFLIIFVFVYGILFLSPNQFDALFDALPWASLQLSNYYFAVEANYFDLANKDNPLLHTWSLGVEEQFYLFFPLLFLGFVWSDRYKNRGVIFLSIALISLLVFVVLHFLKLENWAFYTFATRIWQFLAGAIAFVIFSTSNLLNKTNRFLRITLTILNLFLLATFFFNQSNGFQERILSTVTFTTLSVVTIILGSSVISCKQIIWKPFLFCGNMSYSLYLWHWPILCFFNFLNIDGNTILIQISLLFFFSILSYHLVESKFRMLGKNYLESSYSYNLKHSYPVCILFLLGISSVVFSRFTLSSWRVQELKHVTDTRLSEEKIRNTSIYPSGKFSYDKLIDKLTPTHKKNVLLLGDSHAISLGGSFIEMCKELGLEPLTYLGTSFYPFSIKTFRFYKKKGGFSKVNYEREQQQLIKMIEKADGPKTVVVSTRMDCYFHTSLPFDNYTHAGLGDNPQKFYYHYKENEKTIKSDVLKFVKTIKSKNKCVIFISQHPPLDTIHLDTQYQPIGLYYFNSFSSKSRFIEDYNSRIGPWNIFLKELKNAYPNTVFVVDAEHIITSPYLSGNILYRDDDHLNVLGARLIIEQLKQVLQNLK